MAEWLKLIPVTDSLTGGLLAVVIVMILTGRLVPGKERDYWREAFLEEQRQKRDLMAISQVTRDVLTSIPDPSARS